MISNNSQTALVGTTLDGLGAESGTADAPGNPFIEIVILSVILSIFCVLGTVGNALAFIIYYQKREKGTSTIFILSLAVTDFLTCLVNLPYTIVSLLLDYRLEYEPICKIFLYIGTFNVPLSSLIMVAIGIDRYLCICHPFLHIVTVPRAKVCVIILVVISALLGIVPALSHAIYRYRDNSTDTASLNSTLTATILPAVNDSGFSSPSSSTRVFTSGLFLQPADEFMNDFHRQNSAASYRPEHSNFTSPTSSSVTALPFLNMTTSSYTSLSSDTTHSQTSDKYFDGVCVEDFYILSEKFQKTYQLVYALSFLVEFLILALLYALIYRSILVRRAWKMKRKRMSCYASTNCPETIAEETQLTNINGGVADTVVLKKNPGRISSAMRDRTLHANIKTAAMLFVVTVGFVISFLPSWLIGLRILQFRVSVFYMFYINNVINPFIYAFMNRTFRDDLFQLLRSLFRH